ncbi:hypothetical protein GCM10008921_05700 [Metaclostridioides mangenotii]
MIFKRRTPSPIKLLYYNIIIYFIKIQIVSKKIVYAVNEGGLKFVIPKNPLSIGYYGNYINMF